MDREKHPYFHLAMALFFSLSGVALLVFFLFRGEIITTALGKVMSALSPIFVGFAISYILRPLAQGMENHLQFLKRFARPVSVILAVLIAVAAVSLFLSMVLPQLTSSIRSLVTTLPDQMEELLIRVESYMKRDEGWSNRLFQMINGAEGRVVQWLEENWLNSIGTIASNIYTVGSFVVNLLMSLIVAIYLLLARERYIGQCKKLFLAISKNKRFNRLVFAALEQTNRIFSGFINGKLLDSLIVGVICFVVLSIMKMPYALLISVIVGVTNIIPVFGPFIGAIPSAFLVLLVSPPKCVAFLVFIVVLQQIDGNIIGPRILGDSTGLSALYVMTAMLLFGRLLGFLGMVIGVPLFATLYYIVKQIAEHSLRKQDMTLDTALYAEKGIPEKEK